MRSVRIARSAEQFFYVMLEQGAEKFGAVVAEAKLLLVLDCLRNHLAENPRLGRHDDRLNLCTYHVGKTPFVLVYEYDDAEVRVLFIVHERADPRRLDRADVVW